MMRVKNILFTCLLLQGSFAIAQIVPNPYFESWNTTNTNIPKNWNVYGNYAKTAGKTTTSALRLNNTSFQQAAYAYQAVFDTSFLYGPGYPYAGTPDSVEITYRAALDLDTAYVQISFSKTGESFPVTLDQIKLFNTSGNWVTKTFPITYVNPTDSLEADSGWIFIKSADDIDGPFSSGFIEFDEIFFSYKNNNSAPVIPNNTFDLWDSYSLEYPAQWATSAVFLERSGVPTNSTTKTTDKHLGNYAVKLQGFTITNPDALLPDTFPGFAVTVRDGSSPNFLNLDLETPAFPVSQRFQSIRGFLKSNLLQADRATVIVSFFDADSIVGSAIFNDANNHSSWYEFAEDIAWDSAFKGTPDSATIALLVCDTLLEKVGSLSSWVIFDDLHLDNYNVGTRKIVANTLRAKVYPNPSNGNIQLQFQSEVKGTASIEIHTINGSIVYKQQVLAQSGLNVLPLDLAALSKGIYYLTLQTNEGIFTQKILLTP